MKETENPIQKYFPFPVNTVEDSFWTSKNWGHTTHGNSWFSSDKTLEKPSYGGIHWGSSGLTVSISYINPKEEELFEKYFSPQILTSDQKEKFGQIRKIIFKGGAPSYIEIHGTKEFNNPLLLQEHCGLSRRKGCASYKKKPIGTRWYSDRLFLHGDRYHYFKKQFWYFQLERQACPYYSSVHRVYIPARCRSSNHFTSLIANLWLLIVNPPWTWEHGGSAHKYDTLMVQLDRLLLVSKNGHKTWDYNLYWRLIEFRRKYIKHPILYLFIASQLYFLLLLLIRWRFPIS